MARSGFFGSPGRCTGDSLCYRSCTRWPSASGSPLITYGGGLVSAVELLVKLNTGLLVLAFFLVTALVMEGNRLANLLRFGSTLVATLAVLWFVAGQDVGNVDDCFRATLDVISGYSAAMSLDGIETLRALLYKPALRWLVLDRRWTYRMVPANAPDGLLLSTPPSADFGAPRSDSGAFSWKLAPRPNATTITFEKDAGVASPDNRMRIDFFAMRVRPTHSAIIGADGE
jgi:hypothetical protein